MKRLTFILVLVSLFTVANAQSFENINSDLPGLALSVCSFEDVDNDGDLDLYLAGFTDDGSIAGGLYVYDESGFTLSETSGLPAVYMGACSWGDVDGDNDMDVVIMGQNASFTDITEVYQNNGDGTFTSLNAGIMAAEQGEINLVDFDGDNDLDLAFTGTESVNYTKVTKFYENDGTGVFTELTGIDVPGMDLGRMKWADYDNDNDLDFVLSGFDSGTGSSNTFYVKIFDNNGDASFTVSDIEFYQCWLGDTEWGDFNNDGNIDLVISGAGGDGAERYTLLYKNNGDGTFTELDMGFPGVSHSGLEWADFNGDGRLDLFIVGENTTPGDGNSISNVFINNGDETFTDSGADNLNFSFYGDADAGDYDNDGKVDLVITGYKNISYETGSAIFKNITVMPTMYELTFNVVNGNGTIEASAGTNILTSPASVLEGTEITFTATPDADYKIKEWTLDGVVLDNTADTYILNINSASEVTVEFVSTVSVVTLNNNAVSLYPNPTSGVLQLDCDNVNNIVELTVLTVSGEVLIQKTEIIQNEIIDLSSFESGVYIVNLKTKREVFTTKVIKQN